MRDGQLRVRLDESMDLLKLVEGGVGHSAWGVHRWRLLVCVVSASGRGSTSSSSNKSLRTEISLRTRRPDALMVGPVLRLKRDPVIRRWTEKRMSVSLRVMNQGSRGR